MGDKKANEYLQKKVKEFQEVYGTNLPSAVPKGGFTTIAVERLGFPPMKTEEELRWAHTCTMSTIHRVFLGAFIGGGFFLATGNYISYQFNTSQARSHKIQTNLKFRYENKKWPHPNIVTGIMTSRELVFLHIFIL